MILGIAVVLFLIFMALWRRDIFLYFMAAPVTIVYGLAWRGYYDTTEGLVTSLVLVGIGLYCLIMGIYNTVRKFF